MAFRLPTQAELTEQTIEHWQEFCPKMVRTLGKRLRASAAAAARLTLDACDRLIASGLHPLEAWAMMRNEWCLIPAEDHQEPKGFYEETDPEMDEMYPEPSQSPMLDAARPTAGETTSSPQPITWRTSAAARPGSEPM